MKRFLFAMAMLWLLTIPICLFSAQTHSRSPDSTAVARDTVRSLQDTIFALEEVQINTGYQQLAIERITGSFVHIDRSLLDKRVTTGILERLDGVTSGLIFNRNNQGSGNETPISIRGRSTLFANPEPLIILDDFPFEGDVNSINPDDIESITVLKDAAAASIWGVRAGNGVIVINSKRGRNNTRTRVKFNATTTTSSKPDLYYAPQMSSAEFIEVERFLFSRGKYNATINNGYGALSPAVEVLLKGRNNQLTEAEVERELELLSGYDIWQDMDRYMYRTGLDQQYRVELSGGGVSNDYLMSYGMDRNRSTQVAENLGRHTVNIRNGYRFAGDRLTLTSALLFSSLSGTSNTRRYRPDYPYDQLVNADGSSKEVTDGTLRLSYLEALDPELGLLDWYYRPLDERDANFKRSGSDMRLSTNLKLRPTKPLSVSLSYLFSNSNAEYVRYDSADSYFTRDRVNTFSSIDPVSGELFRGIPPGGIREKGTQSFLQHSVRAQVDYNSVIGRHHDISALIGAEFSHRDGISGARTVYGHNPSTETNLNGTLDFTRDYRYFYRSTTARLTPGISDSYTADRMISYYGNVSYSLKSKYILSASFRRDASNLFGVKSNQKWVPLWSVGTTYRLSEEEFYGISWLPKLSFRASYGYNGNIDRTMSAYLTARVAFVGPFWNSLYSNIVNPPNPALRWERVRNINVGMEFATLGGQIEGNIQYFHKAGLDLIGDTPVAPQVGVSSLRGNAASMKTKGMDIEVSTRYFRAESPFQWRTALLFSVVRDKITKYSENRRSNWDVISGNYLNPLVGYPYHSIFAYDWQGLDTQGAPRIKLNGEVSQDYAGVRNSTDHDDLVFVGTGSPEVFGSLRNELRWNDFQLSFNIGFKAGYHFRRKSLDNSSLYNSFDFQQADYPQRWQERGDEKTTDVPALIYPANLNRTNVYTHSDILVERGDHLRIRDLQFGYVFSGVRTFEQTRLFFHADNLGVLWRRNKVGVDPDHRTLLPGARYSLGLSITLK